MERFVDDDVGYLAWLDEHSNRYVINAERNPKPSYLRLHRTTRLRISGTPANRLYWTRNYIKMCGDKSELRSWARDSVGGCVGVPVLHVNSS